CPATATSRGASTPTCAATTSPHRRSSSRTRSPAGSTSTGTTSPSVRTATAARCSSRTSGRRRRTSKPRSRARSSQMFTRQYATVFEGDDRWRALPATESDLFEWDDASTYIKHPPYFVDMPPKPAAVQDITGARVLALHGYSITTDHISPASSHKEDTTAR